MKPYGPIYQSGIISIENIPEENFIEGKIGIQIAEDGRIWVCIDGQAFLRFKPIKSTDMDIFPEETKCWKCQQKAVLNGICGACGEDN